MKYSYFLHLILLELDVTVLTQQLGHLLYKIKTPTIVFYLLDHVLAPRYDVQKTPIDNAALIWFTNGSYLTD